MKSRSGYLSPAPHRRSSGTPVRPYRVGGKTYTPNGEREVERRKRALAKALAKAGERPPA